MWGKQKAMSKLVMCLPFYNVRVVVCLHDCHLLPVPLNLIE